MQQGLLTDNCLADVPPPSRGKDRQTSVVSEEDTQGWNEVPHHGRGTLEPRHPYGQPLLVRQGPWEEVQTQLRGWAQAQKKQMPTFPGLFFILVPP